MVPSPAAAIRGFAKLAARSVGCRTRERSEWHGLVRHSRHAGIGSASRRIGELKGAECANKPVADWALECGEW
jgi:hypothetical protein